jgi:hypothetical protein
MERAHWKERKEFSDLIGPLYRFIHSRVGRKWDDVYSEICANLKGRNTQQQHIINHLWQYVERYVEVLPNGSVRSKSARWWRVRDDGDFIYSDFYIDPRTGILCKSKPWRRRYKGPRIDPDAKRIDGREYRRENGLWFEQTVEIVPDSYRDWRTQELIYTTKNVVRRRSLNTKELKDLGLKNDQI